MSSHRLLSFRLRADRFDFPPNLLGVRTNVVLRERPKTSVENWKLFSVARAKRAARRRDRRGAEGGIRQHPLRPQDRGAAHALKSTEERRGGEEAAWKSRIRG